MRPLADFLERFVLPLCAGGEVHVGEPLGGAAVARWEVDLAHASLELYAVDRSRGAVAAELTVRPPQLVFGSDELRLTAALHDALLLTHPITRGPFLRRARSQVAAQARELAAVEAPESRDVIVARHALLHRFPDLIRVDTRVSWWSGRAWFRGSEPPSRMLRWRDLRRVREDRDEVPLGRVVERSAAEEVLARLFAASPLTDLLSLGTAWRRTPPFRWGGQLAVLRDPELARAVAYRWLAATTPPAPSGPADGAVRLRAAGAAAVAWERALSADLPAADLRAITAFLVHVGALLALGESHLADLDAPTPYLAGAPAPRDPDLAPTEVAGVRLFFAIPDAAARADPALGAPPGLRGEPRLARRFAVHRAQARSALGDEGITLLSRRLAARLGG